jgi:hypothetical protein
VSQHLHRAVEREPVEFAHGDRCPAPLLRDGRDVLREELKALAR